MLPDWCTGPELSLWFSLPQCRGALMSLPSVFSWGLVKCALLTLRDLAALLLLIDALISWMNGWLKPRPALLEAGFVTLLWWCLGWRKEPPAAPWGALVQSALWRCNIPKCQQGNEQWFFWHYKDGSACTALIHSRTGQMIDRAGRKSYFLLKLTRPEEAHITLASYCHHASSSDENQFLDWAMNSS